jgi:hypothetical protein
VPLGGGGDGSRYKLPGTGGPGPDYVAYVIVFLGGIIIHRLYKLTLPDQAQVTLQLTVSSPDLVQRRLPGPLMLGEGRGGQPALGGPGFQCHITIYERFCKEIVPPKVKYDFFFHEVFLSIMDNPYYRYTKNRYRSPTSEFVL